MTCSKCGAQQPDKNKKRSECNADLHNEASITQNTTPDLPMKWYNFLIYFALFFGALINIKNAIQYLNGSMTYHLFGDYFNGINTGYGISVLTIAILMIIARFRLSSFKKNGPGLFCGLCILSTVMATIYILAVVSLIDFCPYLTDAQKAYSSKTLTISSIITLSIYVIFIVLNIRYFAKRKHLFCK